MAGGQKNGYEPIKMQLSRPVLRVKKARVISWTGPGSTMKCCVEEGSENLTRIERGFLKGAACCDKLRVGARSLRSGDSRMGLPTPGDTWGTPIWEGEPAERKHPSRRWRRNQLRFPD